MDNYYVSETSSGGPLV